MLVGERADVCARDGAWLKTRDARRERAAAVTSDILTPAQRSFCMSRIRVKNTKPELIIRRALHASGFRFRIHADLPGKPDLVLRKHRAVILVNGCYWHGHRKC